jgi:(S)-ureidoglycine aminohydrolase
MDFKDCAKIQHWVLKLSYKGKFGKLSLTKNIMHNLGSTRGSQQPNHLLLTPDTFVRTTLPGMKGCVAVVHIGPAMGARFTEYTVEFETDGEMAGTRAQRFIFVLEGAVKLEMPDKQFKLRVGGFAYAPEATTHRITATEKSRVAVIEKTYESLPGAAPPHLIVSHEDKVVSHPAGEDSRMQMKCLLPEEMSFDFAVNTMVYQPGAALSMVEMHIMEHGLIMLEGGGIYRLGDSWYPVSAGDFIWMGPWCPQWFGAIGKIPAKYLVYKDSNRHPLAGV